MGRRSLCKIHWCDRLQFTMGYCQLHYERSKTGYDMDAPIRVNNIHRDSCKATDCTNIASGSGYCTLHAQRIRRGTPLDKPIQSRGSYGRLCSVPDCGRPHKSLGYCNAHVTRFRKYGDALAGRPIGLPTVWDNVKFGAAHLRVRRLWGKASQYPCIACGGDAKDWAYDGTDPTQLYGTYTAGGSKMFYSRFPEFYMPMCAGCHLRRDGALLRVEVEEYRTLKNLSGLSFKDIAVKLGIDEVAL